MKKSGGWKFGDEKSRGSPWPKIKKGMGGGGGGGGSNRYPN